MASAFSIVAITGSSAAGVRTKIPSPGSTSAMSAVRSPFTAPAVTTICSGSAAMPLRWASVSAIARRSGAVLALAVLRVAVRRATSSG
jgi:hypothetical protein